MYFEYDTFREFYQSKWKPLRLKSWRAVKTQYFCVVPNEYDIKQSRFSRIFAFIRKLDNPEEKNCYGLVKLESLLTFKVIIIVIQRHMSLCKATRKTSADGYFSTFHNVCTYFCVYFTNLSV